MSPGWGFSSRVSQRAGRRPYVAEFPEFFFEEREWYCCSLAHAGTALGVNHTQRAVPVQRVGSHRQDHVPWPLFNKRDTRPLHTRQRVIQTTLHSHLARKQCVAPSCFVFSQSPELRSFSQPKVWGGSICCAKVSLGFHFLFAAGASKVLQTFTLWVNGKMVARKEHKGEAVMTRGLGSCLETVVLGAPSASTLLPRYVNPPQIYTPGWVFGRKLGP